MQNAYASQNRVFPPKVTDDAVVNEMIRSLAIFEKAVEMISIEAATIIEAEHVLQVW